ncbi:FAD binding domain-containing protein [Sinomonas susongensis]|uniref:FAD binding domain-containing protein n=1 Tax=Sinomonas susongensis TaxID=1324851 RepID=UPI0011085E64|nr:FAD binding domain-containing protein [Sinomonas susongensis]
MDLNTIEALVPTADPAEWREGDAWLGGGTVLFSYGSQTLRRLLDLTSAGWEPIEEDDDGITIAATCTIARLWQAGDPSGAMVARWPGLGVVRTCCDAFVASFKIWNLSTVGGNIATSLPAGPMTSLCAGLDGVATLWGAAGVREVAVADLVTGDGRNALVPGELIRSIRLPAHALESRTAFRRLSLSNLGRSGVLLIGRRDVDGAFVLTVTASTRRPVQLRFAAGALPDARNLAAALDDAIPAALYHDDIHGLPAWRRDMTYRLGEELRLELLGGERAGGDHGDPALDHGEGA